MPEQTDRFHLRPALLQLGISDQSAWRSYWNAASDWISAEVTQPDSGAPGGLWGDLRNVLGAIDEATGLILLTDFCKGHGQISKVMVNLDYGKGHGQPWRWQRSWSTLSQGSPTWKGIPLACLLMRSSGTTGLTDSGSGLVE